VFRSGKKLLILLVFTQPEFYYKNTYLLKICNFSLSTLLIFHFIRSASDW
jgi:hypothetical protein